MANYKLLPLLIIFSLVPLGPLAIDVYLPSFPQMMDAFGVSDSEIRQTISIYILALGVSQLIAGPVSDKKGRKFSAMLGLFLYALGALLVVASSSLPMLLVARGLQGVGASFTMITAMAWIRDNFEGEAAGKWLSYMGGVTSAIPTIAPLIGSGLAMLWGWSSGFYLMASLAMLLFVLAAVALEAKPITKLTIDIKDSQALTCSVKDILTNRTFITYAVANMLSFGGLLTYISVAPIIAMTEGGFGQVQFSLMFGVIGGTQILASILAPKLIKAWGRRSTVRFGSGVIVVGGIGLMFVPIGGTYVFFLVAAFGAVGFSILSGSATSLALEPFKYCAGLATSIDGFSRMIGGALLVALSSSLGLGSIVTLALVYLLPVLSMVLTSLEIKNLESLQH